jgi:hypothetical protein
VILDRFLRVFQFISQFSVAQGRQIRMRDGVRADSMTASDDLAKLIPPEGFQVARIRRISHGSRRPTLGNCRAYKDRSHETSSFQHGQRGSDRAVPVVKRDVKAGPRLSQRALEFCWSASSSPDKPLDLTRQSPNGRRQGALPNVINGVITQDHENRSVNFW